MMATGLPRDKTVMTSPLAASRSRLEKWRLASPAAMVFTRNPKVVLSTTLQLWSASRQEVTGPDGHHYLEGPSRLQASVSKTTFFRCHLRMWRYQVVCDSHIQPTKALDWRDR